jgi:mRNA interferase HigB
MRVIKRLPLVRFWKKWPRAEKPLREWYRLTRRAAWRNFLDVKGTFGQADQVATWKSGNTVTIFDIGGNKFRIIAAVHFNAQKVFVLRVLTHKEYDSDLWRKQL